MAGTILIVEDERDIAELVASRLRSEGYLSTALSLDAVPTLVDGLDDLEPALADALLGRLCARFAPDTGRGLDWYRGREAAAGALAERC